MLSKVKNYFSGRDWKFWAKVGGIVAAVIFLLVIGENTEWTAE